MEEGEQRGRDERDDEPDVGHEREQERHDAPEQGVRDPEDEQQHRVGDRSRAAERGPDLDVDDELGGQGVVAGDHVARRRGEEPGAQLVGVEQQVGHDQDGHHEAGDGGRDRRQERARDREQLARVDDRHLAGRDAGREPELLGELAERRRQLLGVLRDLRAQRDHGRDERGGERPDDQHEGDDADGHGGALADATSLEREHRHAADDRREGAECHGRDEPLGQGHADGEHHEAGEDDHRPEQGARLLDGLAESRAEREPRHRRKRSPPEAPRRGDPAGRGRRSLG